MFEKGNQNITQVFTPSTHCEADVVLDFQDSALPGPIHNQIKTTRAES